MATFTVVVSDIRPTFRVWMTIGRLLKFRGHCVAFVLFNEFGRHFVVFIIFYGFGRHLHDVWTTFCGLYYFKRVWTTFGRPSE